VKVGRHANDVCLRFNLASTLTRPQWQIHSRVERSPGNTCYSTIVLEERDSQEGGSTQNNKSKLSTKITKT